MNSTFDVSLTRKLALVQAMQAELAAETSILRDLDILDSDRMRSDLSAYISRKAAQGTVPSNPSTHCKEEIRGLLRTLTKASACAKRFHSFGAHLKNPKPESLSLASLQAYSQASASLPAMVQQELSALRAELREDDWDSDATLDDDLEAYILKTDAALGVNLSDVPNYYRFIHGTGPIYDLTIEAIQSHYAEIERLLGVYAADQQNISRGVNLSEAAEPNEARAHLGVCSRLFSDLPYAQLESAIHKAVDRERIAKERAALEEAIQLVESGNYLKAQSLLDGQTQRSQHLPYAEVEEQIERFRAHVASFSDLHDNLLRDLAPHDSSALIQNPWTLAKQEQIRHALVAQFEAELSKVHDSLGDWGDCDYRREAAHAIQKQIGHAALLRKALAKDTFKDMLRSTLILIAAFAVILYGVLIFAFRFLRL